MLPKPLSWNRAEARLGVFDGKFIVGVMTTGIYCLPSCAARPPKAENIRVVATEAQAQALGLRACKRCRPDLFYRGEDQDASIFEGLARRVRRDLSAFPNARALAKAAGISASKLTSLIRARTGQTPAVWLKCERIEAAQKMLQKTNARVTDVALAVGFDSESAFHRQFLARTRTTPARYRQKRAA